MPAKTIAFGAHPVDRHLAGSSEQKVQFLEAPYAIPYDCMISKHSPNLLAAGGGISGAMAAIGAARTGAKTLLIEKYGFLGGMLTAAGVGPMMSFHAGEQPLADSR